MRRQGQIRTREEVGFAERNMTTPQPRVMVGEIPALIERRVTMLGDYHRKELSVLQDVGQGSLW